MTTPDDPKPAAWGAVGRLLATQLLAVVAVTAVITGIYALTGPHRDDEITAAGSAPSSTSSAPSRPATSSPKASAPAATPVTSPPASPATSSPPPGSAARPKVDVLNQSAPGGTASKIADQVRAGGWTVGRVDDFRGNISTTTVYYFDGQATAAHELADALPGKQRVLPRFSTISAKRLTVIVTR